MWLSEDRKNRDVNLGVLLSALTQCHCNGRRWGSVGRSSWLRRHQCTLLLESLQVFVQLP